MEFVGGPAAAYLSVLALVVSLVPTDGALAAAEFDEIPAVEDQVPTTRVEDLDLSAERAIAIATGEPVEVLEARTEDSSTFVNPDGTMSAELYAGPIRVMEDEERLDIDSTYDYDGLGRLVEARRLRPGGFGFSGDEGLWVRRQHQPHRSWVLKEGSWPSSTSVLGSPLNAMPERSITNIGESIPPHRR